MKRIVFILFLVVAMAAWSTPGFARQPADGPGNTALLQEGVTNGVDMTNGAGTGTLTVGVVGGPDMNIFEANNPVGTVPGLAVSTDASSMHNILFNSGSTVYGDIGITNPGGPFFLDIHAGKDTTTVNFLGSVFATKIYADQTGIVNFKNGGTNYGATYLSGGGTIYLGPNTKVIGRLWNPGGANSGTLSLSGGSTLDGAVGAEFPLANINMIGGSSAQPVSGVSATITGEVKAYKFSLGTNTLNISGALAIGPNGTIETTLGSATIYGNIVVTGASTLGTGLTVRVTVPTTTLLLVGDHFHIVTGAGSNNLATVDPTNSLYTFSIWPDPAGAATIEILTIPAQAPIVNPPADPITQVAGVVADALLNTPTTPDLEAVIAAINALTTPEAVVDAEAQLAPLAASLAAPLVTFQGNRQFQNLWLTRLDMCSQFSWLQPGEDDSSCQGKNQRSGWWQKAFGYFGIQKDHGIYKGYKSKILGTMIAYDAPLGSDTRGGLGFGYARNLIDGNKYDINTDFNTYKAMAYIGHELGNWFVNGAASFGWNQYSGRRHIVFPGIDRTAHAEYDGQDYTAFASTGYHFSAQKFMITPLVSLQYSRVNISGYTEKGAGDINLRVRHQSYNFYEAGLGTKVERAFKYRGGTFVPDMHFKWLHDISNPGLKRAAEFNVPNSKEFITPGLTTEDNTYSVGIGLTLLSCACRATEWQVEAGYDYDWREDNYSANLATIRLTKRF